MFGRAYRQLKNLLFSLHFLASKLMLSISWYPTRNVLGVIFNHAFETTCCGYDRVSESIIGYHGTRYSYSLVSLQSEYLELGNKLYIDSMSVCEYGFLSFLVFIFRIINFLNIAFIISFISVRFSGFYRY